MARADRAHRPARPGLFLRVSFPSIGTWKRRFADFYRSGNASSSFILRGEGARPRSGGRLAGWAARPMCALMWGAAGSTGAAMGMCADHAGSVIAASQQSPIPQRDRHACIETRRGTCQPRRPHHLCNLRSIHWPVAHHRGGENPQRAASTRLLGRHRLGEPIQRMGYTTQRSRSGCLSACYMSIQPSAQAS